MFNIVSMYINKLTKDDVNNFALKKGANLSNEELDFTYLFIKKNWKDVLKNPSIFDIDRYKGHYSNENFLKIKQVLNNFQNEEFKVIVSDLESSTQRKINTLATLTPAIITSDKGDYLINNDMQLVKERILANAQKKYNQLYNEKINMDFIKSIKQTNNKPIKIPYKSINILGYKFEIEVKDDPISQNLAYLILSVGLLEKNAEGFGFCKAK